MVLDNAGNVGHAQRIVYVVGGDDTEPPVITLKGPNPVNLEVGNDYQEYGATAEDNVDGEIPEVRPGTRRYIPGSLCHAGKYRSQGRHYFL